jgi:hypothetical protein
MSIKKNSLIRIENKVFSKEDIQNIAKIAWEEYSLVKDGCLLPNFSSYVKCYDTVSYNSNEIDIFEDSSPIYNEEIKVIEISAVCQDLLGIRIRLQHGYEKGDKDKIINISEIEISSSNISKLRDIEGNFRDFLKGVQPQDNIIYKTRKFVSWCIFIACTISLGFLLDKSNTDQETLTFWEKAFTSISSFIGSLIVAGLFGGIIPVVLYSAFFVDKSLHLWPTVEFQINNHSPHLARKKLYVSIIGLVIIPILLAIAYDVFKFIILK